MDDFFQSCLSLKELSSIFDTSPPCHLLKVITQQSVVSTSSPQICIVGASFKLSVSFEILSRRCFLSFSMSSVTGRRSGLLNFCLCSVARELYEMLSLYSFAMGASRFSTSCCSTWSFSLNALPFEKAMHLFYCIAQSQCERWYSH